MLTVLITLVAVLEMFSGMIYAAYAPKNGPALAALGGVLGSPILFVLALAKGDFVLLFWLFWAVYDPWRTTAVPNIVVAGPFPVQVSPQAPPPAAPAGESPARGAGLDFEHPQ